MSYLPKLTMTHPDASPADDAWVATADVHRDTYRIFCAIAALLSPAFGLVYHYTNPEGTDPLWLRGLLATPFLGLLVLSYTSAWVKEHLIRFVHGFFYVLLTAYVGLTALNAFTPNYALGLLFVITAIGVAFSLGLKRLGPLVRYLVFSVVLTVPASFLLSDPQASPTLVCITVLSTALIIYVVAHAKIHAEAAAQASEQRYKTLMNAAKDAIFITDPEVNLLVDANRQARTLIGRSLDEIRRMRPVELYPDDKREHYGALFEVHLSEESSITEDLYVEHRSGRLIPVDVNASLIKVGDRTYIQGIFRDATERHRYEEQLIQAKERAEDLLHLKSSFLNNMSHELRTPLTAILGFAEMLAEEVSGEQQAHALTIANSAQRLHNTLNSVLDLAQLESEQTVPERRRTNVVGEVREAVSLMRPMAEQKGLALSVVAVAREIYIDIDPSILNRIVNNLVSNAIKFTDEGRVTVEIGGGAERVHVRVRDTGIGISETFQQHLFDEFRQESSGLSRSHEGYGLGLAITKRLVDLMDGAIEVESTKGAGSTFTVHFPRAAPASNGSTESNGSPASSASNETHEARPAPPPAAPPVATTAAPVAAPAENGHSRSSLQARRVLVLEDNVSTQDLLGKQLDGPYQPALASSPTKALRLARSQAFDLFVLDIHLSAAQDGLDVLRALRTMPEYAATPAIALTAYAMPGDRERFLGAGFDNYLSKPFTKKQLLDAVRQSLLSPSAPQ